MFKRISAVIVLAACVVSPAAAQEKSASERSVASSFEELTRKLHKAYSMKGRTVVYRAPGTKALIAPAITPHGAGVAVTVRF